MESDFGPFQIVGHRGSFDQEWLLETSASASRNQPISGIWGDFYVCKSYFAQLSEEDLCLGIYVRLRLKNANKSLGSSLENWNFPHVLCWSELLLVFWMWLLDLLKGCCSSETVATDVLPKPTKLPSQNFFSCRPGTDTSGKELFFAGECPPLHSARLHHQLWWLICGISYTSCRYKIVSTHKIL